MRNRKVGWKQVGNQDKPRKTRANGLPLVPKAFAKFWLAKRRLPPLSAAPHRNWDQFPTGEREGMKFSVCPCTLSSSWGPSEQKHEVPFPHVPSYVCPAVEQPRLCGSGHAVLFAVLFTIFFFFFSPFSVL